MRRFDLEIRWRWSGDLDPVSAAPPFRLLSAIRSCGSLKAAASAIGVSYRHAWGLLGTWEARLGKPLVRLERGRGAGLTELGERLLWAERKAQARIAPDLDSLADEFDRELAAELGTPAVLTLRVSASHDLLLARVRERLVWEPEFALHVDFRGSLDCLADLSRGRCDLAGFHASVPADLAAAAEMRRWLKPRLHQVIRFADREQGLMLAVGNPHGIRSLPDLARPGVRFINRQRGSGTRLLLDRLLDEAGVDARAVDGYGAEEFTHLAVAATVAGGGADAAFGIRAAAARYGLDFAPLARERYGLACRAEFLEHPGALRLLAFLRGPEFRHSAARLAGYDPRHGGEVADVDAFLSGADESPAAAPPG